MKGFKRLFPKRLSLIRRCSHSSALSFATIDPNTMRGCPPHRVHPDVHVVHNLLAGDWVESIAAPTMIPDPLNGKPFLYVSNTSRQNEIDEFVHSLNSCPKSGLHNPLKNPERYTTYGDICATIAAKMKDPAVMDFFTRLIQRVAPKSYAQAYGEVAVTRKFIENFGGDQVRFLAKGFHVSGDHVGQLSCGYRWPYGPVALITPFNFPIEIPAL